MIRAKQLYVIVLCIESQWRNYSTQPVYSFFSLQKLKGSASASYFSSNTLGHHPHKSLLYTQNLADGSVVNSIACTSSKDFSAALITTTSPSAMPTTTLASQAITVGSDLDLNINAIKDRLMTTRVPESCV